MWELNDGMEWVFRYYGRSLNQAKESLPPRDDVMEFYVRTNTKDLEKNMKLLGCPSDLQYNVKEVVTEYWDVFCENGFRRSIRGFSFHIDTGNHPHIYCEPPMYVPDESEVVLNLVESLDTNGVLEEDDVPWGELVVLAEKPHQ